ncbi:MAG: hypothetical protein ACOZNI_35700 [Myxococcota bacterium]
MVAEGREGGVGNDVGVGSDGDIGIDIDGGIGIGFEFGGLPCGRLRRASGFVKSRPATSR